MASTRPDLDAPRATLGDSGDVLRLLDLAGFLGAIPLFWLLFSSNRLLPEKRPAPDMLLITGTAAGLFVASFSYVQLNDTYIVSLLSLRPPLQISVALRDTKTQQALDDGNNRLVAGDDFHRHRSHKPGLRQAAGRMGQRRKSSRRQVLCMRRWPKALG